MYRHVTRPLAAKLAPYRFITPNRVSIAAFVAGGVVAPLFISQNRLRAAGLAFVVSDMLDYLDGDVARAQGTMSTGGDILDGILDRYTDVLCLGAMTMASAGGFGKHRPARPAFIRQPGSRLAAVVGLAATIGSVMPSYIKALAVANGHSGTVQSIGGRGTRNRVIFTGLLARDPFWTLATIGFLSNAASLHRATSTLAVSAKYDREARRQRNVAEGPAGNAAIGRAE
ncbi:CDP-alcohol phosphatidyltransferase family protein [Streptomyces sp. NRRL S-1824]|uniref:CDP-alcohol phosphatidyltransferase family protein n=1 Tax=Streptomyces sp. NRRL S-1824 TaxID=1463889 RepID=UPI00131C3B53|nr:CDP-alcohol phosphatidyltransferase family protein [Streptomyces sp. NRRL S-1824]